MKKIITIILVSVLTSCSAKGIYDGDVVIEINTTEAATKYTSRHCFGRVYFDNTFNAPTGLYKVGDTIHFVNKNQKNIVP